MKYLKSLFFNFLIVFFANHILPGIEVTDMTKLPHLGGDLIFSIVLGLLNSLIYPGLKILGQPTTMPRIALVALGLNFLAYALLKLLPVGIKLTSVEGYLLGTIVVSLGSFFLNYLEMKSGHHHAKPHTPPSEPTDPK
jgi:uncharacterized membrane protein YvlD (DUF360 family)